MKPSASVRTPLTPDVVLTAYAAGMFPMADPATRSIDWYAPDPRGIIELDRFTVPRSLRRTIRSGSFTIAWDTDFEGVMRGCAEREETWISDEIITAYVSLYKLGRAHSVECWSDNELVGGLYGVALGSAFFGESMFSRRTDASKVALTALVERMRARSFTLLDTQFMTDHLSRFGGREIPRSEYLRRLRFAVSEKRILHP